MGTKNNLRVAEVTVSYKTMVKAVDRPKISSSIETFQLLQSN